MGAGTSMSRKKVRDGITVSISAVKSKIITKD
jgi:hypothetical protein